MSSIRRNHSSYAPSNHVVTYTIGEPILIADNNKQELLVHKLTRAQRFRWRLGKATGKQSGTADDTRALWGWVYGGLKKKHPTWLWTYKAAEQMAMLDMCEEFEAGHLELLWAVWEAKPYITCCQHDNGKLLILDIRNWINADLGDLLKLTGTDQGEYPPGAEPWDKEELQAETVRICISRLVQSILRVRGELDLGILRTTVAGQALSAFRHRFAPSYYLPDQEIMRTEPRPTTDLTRIFPIPHTDKIAIALEMDGYYGGIFRQWKRGKVDGPIHVVDIQSAYASVMAGNMFPVKLWGKHTDPDLRHLATMCEDYCVIAFVAIDSPSHEYPVRIPTGHAYDVHNDAGICNNAHSDTRGKAVTAVGRYWTTLAGPELQFALAHNHVVRCGLACNYVRMPLFESYVADLWEKRRLFSEYKCPIDARLTKELLASLWGKFGQAAPVWEPAPNVRCLERWGQFVGEDSETGWYGLCRGVAGKTQRRVGYKLANHAFPAVAAYVTSYARVKLWELIETAGQSNCLYAAVDCLHVTDTGFTNLTNAGLIRSGELGYLKHKETLPWAYYHSPTAWWTADRRSISGVPLDSEQLDTYTYECTISEPAVATIYRGVRSGLLRTKYEINIDNWQPPGKLLPSGDVLPRAIEQWH